MSSECAAAGAVCGHPSVPSEPWVYAHPTPGGLPGHACCKARRHGPGCSQAAVGTALPAAPPSNSAPDSQSESCPGCTSSGLSTRPSQLPTSTSDLDPRNPQDMDVACHPTTPRTWSAPPGARYLADDSLHEMSRANRIVHGERLARRAWSPAKSPPAN